MSCFLIPYSYICSIECHILKSPVINKMEFTIRIKENCCFIFRPAKVFYDAVRINRKHWGQIYRGDIEPTIKEAKAIAKYFEVDITELI